MFQAVDELGRTDVLAVDVEPAQRFVRDDLPVPGVADRLEVRHQPPFLERAQDCLRSRAIVVNRLDHLGLIRQADAVFSLTLGAVHHVVRKQEQVLRLRGVLRIDGNTDRTRGAHVRPVRRRERHGSGKRQDASGHGQRAFLLQVQHDGDEFVAAVARQQIALTHDLTQQLRELLQKTIAERVPVRVVDGFEVVEINDQEGEAIRAALRARDLIFEQFPEQPLVVQPG